MPRLPDATDLGAVSARTSSPLLNVGTNPIPGAIQRLGQTVATVATERQATARAESDKTARFDTQRRFLEFSAAQEKNLAELSGQANPGAFGFREVYTKQFQEGAREFFKSVPDDLKGEYDAKLFAIEDQLGGKAYTFERGARKQYYTDRVSDGLTVIENGLYERPDDFDRNLAEGVQFIENLPDDDVSPIEKESLKRAWREKAQLASLNGMKPSARVEALGGPVQPLSKNVDDRAQHAISYFVGRGFTKEQASGIVGNLIAESGLKTDARNPGDGNDGSDSIGIGQWNAERARALKDFAARNRADWRDFNVQLAFVEHELNTSEKGAGAALRNARTVEEATAAMIGYERPQGWSSGNPKGGHNWRGRLRNAMQAAGMEVTPEIDARFADMPYEKREDVIAKAEREVAAEETAARAEAKAAYTQYKDAMTLGIETGGIVREAAILGDSTLDDGDKATLLKALRTRNKETADVSAFLGALTSDGGIAVNPYDTQQTGVADKAFRRFMADVPEDYQASAASAFIGGTGYVPKDVQAELRNGAAATRPDELATAMVQADAIERAAPRSFQAFEGGGEVRDNLAVYRDLVNNRGYSSEEAAGRMLELKSPERKLDREVLGEEARKIAKAIKIGEITDAFDLGVFSAEPGGGLMPSQQNALLAEYRELFEERFYETGDEASAKALASEDLKRTWGVSEISGDKQLMRLPPEKFYPPVDGGFEYLRADAMATAQDYAAGMFDGREAENVTLIPDGRTRADIEAGRPPRYRLFYQYEENGQTLFDEVFAGPWGIEASAIDGMVGAERDATRMQFEQRREQASTEADIMRAGEAGAQRALDQTVGPDWMKARQAEAERERARMRAGETRSVPELPTAEPVVAPTDPFTDAMP